MLDDPADDAALAASRHTEVAKDVRTDLLEDGRIDLDVDVIFDATDDLLTYRLKQDDR